MASPTTVLHLCDCLNPGGTEMQLLAQLRATDRRRFRPLVAWFHDGGELVPEVRALGVPAWSFPLRGSLASPRTLVQIGRIAALCRRERVAIVHAHDFYANLVGLFASRLAGARFLASRRDLAHWLTANQKRALALSCRLADRIGANARAVAELDLDGRPLPPERVVVVPNGIDLGRFDADAAREPRPPIAALADEARRRRAVAVVGNLNLPDKGHADLLDAAALLDGDGAPIELLVVGRGPEQPALEERARRLGLEGRVHFLGRRRDVPSILARVFAAVLPSWAEGVPNAVMEAMAAGRPVVATHVGGCPELIEDGVSGLLVPPREPRALADAIARLLGHRDEAVAMGRAARRRVAERFSIRATAAAWEAVYRGLTGQPGSSREAVG